jgi:hypothetical protein
LIVTADVPSSPIVVTLMMEPQRSFETSVVFCFVVSHKIERALGEGNGMIKIRILLEATREENILKPKSLCLQLF